MEKKVKKKREAITYSVENLCLTVPKKLVREPSRVPKKSLAIERFIHSRGSIIVLPDFFCLAEEKKIVGWNLVFQKRSVMEIFFWLRGKVSRFSVDFFCLIVPKKSQRKPSVFRKILVMKNFVHRMGAFTVLSEMICFTLAKKIVGGHLFSRNVLLWKKRLRKSGRLSRILSKIFVSQCQKNLYGNPPVFQKMPGDKTFDPQEGEHHCLTGFLLSRRGKKIRWVEPCFSETFCYGNIFLAKREGITIFRRFFLSHSAKKISEEAFCVSKNSGNEKFCS